MVFIVIAFFSVVHSFFGIGLLLFGTPSLLLLGVSFEDTLGYLLPATITINILQLLSKHTSIDTHLFHKFFVFCVPCAAISLGLKIKYDIKMGIDLMVGIFLLLTALSRIYNPINEFMKKIVHHCEIPYLVIMGCIHGLSNMGGSLLSVYASSKYNTKAGIVGAISLGYLFFCIAQLLVLLLWKPEIFSPDHFLGIPLAMLSYFFVGKQLFKKISEAKFAHAFTGFIFVFSFLLLTRHFFK